MTLVLDAGHQCPGCPEGPADRTAPPWAVTRPGPHGRPGRALAGGPPARLSRQPVAALLLRACQIRDVTEPCAREAARLRTAAGQAAAISATDAIVAAYASTTPDPVVLTSDLGDLAALAQHATRPITIAPVQPQLGPILHARAPRLTHSNNDDERESWLAVLPGFDVVPLWDRVFMAMNLRLDDEERALLKALAEAEQVSFHEAALRAIRRSARELAHTDRVREATAEMLDRWGEVLDRLGHA